MYSQVDYNINPTLVAGFILNQHDREKYHTQNQLLWVRILPPLVAFASAHPMTSLK